jgi:hypothetical protein
MAPRRELALVVLGCAVAAGLALFAASRAWAVSVVTPPAPLPPRTEAHTGGGLAPLIPACALVGLAGAGALLATRGRARVLVGVLIVASGAGVSTGAALAAHRATGAGLAWVVLCGLAGIGLAAAGFITVRHGQAWPRLGTRYERASVAPAAQPDRTAQSPTDAAMWDAIDRGEDPTKE